MKTASEAEPPPEADLPTVAEIEAAARRIAAHAVRTPLISHPDLDARAGGRVFLKAENLQRTGSFKFRGAFNAVSRIVEARPGTPIVAASSGNHAQGIAAAAALCGVAAKIVMPADAPHMKLARTRALGAEVITYDRAREDRVAIAGEIADACGGAFVHPFDNRDVIAGQGTAGLEIAADLAARDAVADQVLICCAGGGLSAGVGLAVRDRMPGAEIRTVEPAGFDDFARSLAEGERVSNAAAAGSICDALLVQTPGVRNFEIAKTHFSPGLVVTDEEALAAVRYAFEELKLVVEPGGAVALAVILSGKVVTRRRTTVAMLSGGNIDPAVFAKAIA